METEDGIEYVGDMIKRLVHTIQIIAVAVLEDRLDDKILDPMKEFFGKINEGNFDNHPLRFLKSDETK